MIQSEDQHDGTKLKISCAPFVLFTVLLALPACITVNINFPTAEIEEEAERLVEEVRGQEGSGPTDLDGAESAPAEGPPEGALRGGEEASRDPKLRSILVSAPLVWKRKGAGLEEGLSDVDNDAVVQAIKASLKARFPKLVPFFDKGALGESRAAIVELRDLSKLTLKEKNNVKKLRKAENKDRKNLYRRIAVIKGIDPKRIKDIEAIYAKQWIAKARKNWWVQNENKRWEKKKTSPKTVREPVFF